LEILSACGHDNTQQPGNQPLDRLLMGISPEIGEDGRVAVEVVNPQIDEIAYSYAIVRLCQGFIVEPSFIRGAGELLERDGGILRES
jgi:hypothetical protein